MSQALTTTNLSPPTLTGLSFLDLSLETRIKIYKFAFGQSTIILDNHGVVDDDSRLCRPSIRPLKVQQNLEIYRTGASIDILQANKQIRGEGKPINRGSTVLWIKKDHQTTVRDPKVVDIPYKWRRKIRTIYNDTLAQGTRLNLSLFPALLHYVAAHRVLRSRWNCNQRKLLLDTETPNMTNACSIFGGRKQLHHKLRRRFRECCRYRGVQFTFEAVLLDVDYSLKNDYNRGWILEVDIRNGELIKRSPTLFRNRGDLLGPHPMESLAIRSQPNIGNGQSEDMLERGGAV